MKKNGLTIVELIVSFSLAVTIGFFLFKITVIIKNLYIDSYVKTNIISKQNIITERMYDDFLYNDFKVALKCGKNCIRFIFSDYSEKLLEIENDTFKWGDFTLRLTDGSKYGKINVNNQKSLVNDEFNDSLLSIKIQIINDSLNDDTFMTNIVVPYNSNNVHMDDLDFNKETYEYYLVLKDPGAMFLDTESVFTEPGAYVYYGKNTCTMKTDIDYAELKKSPKVITNTFEGEGCENLSIKIDYKVLLKNGSNYKEGEYDIPYTLIIDGEEKTTEKRHVVAFQKEKRFSYKGTINNNESIYEYTFPMSGYYTLEVWGASGLGSESGYGAYSKMTVRFLKGEKVYVYVGQMNNSINGVPNFNTNSNLSFTGFSGGGATDIRLVRGNEDSRIIIAGGGGSGLYNSDGYGTISGSSDVDSGLTETDKSQTTCGSGGGYITYDAVSCSDKASGGTSYFADEIIINGRKAQIIQDNSKYNPLSLAGNEEMKDPYTGYEADHGNSGDGYAIITFIGDKLDNNENIECSVVAVDVEENTDNTSLKLKINYNTNNNILAAKPFSWDNGNTWTDSNEITITEGGTYNYGGSYHAMISDENGSKTECSMITVSKEEEYRYKTRSIKWDKTTTSYVRYCTESSTTTKKIVCTDLDSERLCLNAEFGSPDATPLELECFKEEVKTRELSSYTAWSSWSKWSSNKKSSCPSATCREETRTVYEVTQNK